MGRKRKLVVVSNRGPLRVVGQGRKRRWVRSAGGLVTALDPVLRNRGGVWVSAQPQGDLAYVDVDSPDLPYDTVEVRIPRGDQQGFYQGVSNAILWPIMHSFPTTIRVGEAPWASYAAGNRAFAEGVLAASGPRDMIWVHDYHLMLVPDELRKKRRQSRIGWFCHVPWPSPDLFQILPWRHDIIDGLLGADVLGFHTDLYAANFLDCVERLTDYGVDRGRRRIRRQKHVTQIVATPIGVPFEELSEVAGDPDVAVRARTIRESIGDRRIVLGVDRLDYSKGIPERILAYERFLREHRNAAAEHVYVQVMVPSRTDVSAYAELKAEIDRLVGSVNGRHGRTGRVPIHYLYTTLAQRELFAHYVAADVALVTPLRDGMNLVAHEFVASRTGDDGVLILSELAGAAEYLPDAILVNPYDIREVADAIAEAFQMDVRARKRRMRRLRASVRQLDVHAWADDWVRKLEQGAR